MRQHHTNSKTTHQPSVCQDNYALNKRRKGKTTHETKTSHIKGHDIDNITFSHKIFPIRNKIHIRLHIYTCHQNYKKK